MIRKTFLSALAGATCLQPSMAGAATVYINSLTPIYTGSEYGSDIIVLNDHLRLGTVDVDATLTSPLYMENEDGTLSVTTGSTLRVSDISLRLNYDLTLGSAVDQGTLVLGSSSSPVMMPTTPAEAADITIAGGTVDVLDSGYFYRAHSTTMAAGTELLMNDYATLSSLTGTGTLDGRGNDIVIHGASFSGLIENVGTLVLSSGFSWSEYSQSSMQGVFSNVDVIMIGSGVTYFGAAQTVDSLADVSELYLLAGSLLNMSTLSGTINNLSGGGDIDTTGSLTVNGGAFDGNLDVDGTLTFDGYTQWSGLFLGTGSVRVSYSGDLSTFNSDVFDSDVALAVDGVYRVNASTEIGALTGSGAILLASADLTVDTGGVDSLYSGHTLGDGFLIKDGAGALTIGSSGSLQVDTIVEDGSLVLQTSVLNGDIENNADLIFDLGATNIAYNGALSGTGDFTKLGNGTLTLTGSNAYSGSFSVLDGRLVSNTLGLQGAVFNQAAVTFDQIGTGTYASTMSGSGSLSKTGAGQLIWTGIGTYTGATEVDEGLLTVNGSLASSVTVGSGAALGGSGSVGAIDALSGATIAPGNSIGTLTVAGNANFAAGSIYDVEVNGLGQSDLLDVGGVLTVSSSASVTVGPENGTDTGIDYASPITYTIATASGGVSGTFGSVVDSFAFLDASLSYDPNAIYLTLTRLSFTDSAGTPNEEAAGDAVDSLPNGPVTDALLGVTDEERARALRDLAGEIHASLGQGLSDAAGVERDGVLSELAAPGRGRFWSVAHGTVNRWQTDEVASGGSLQGGGITFGGDLFQADTFTLGIMAGYDSLAMDLSETSAEADIESVHIGAYGAWKGEAMALRFGSIYSSHAIDTARTVDVSTLNERLTADYRGDTVQAFAELSTDAALGDVTIQPFLGAAVIHSQQESFSESGGAAALSGRAEQELFAETSLGVRFDHTMSVGEQALRLYGALGFTHAISEDRSSATLAFDGSQDFTVQGKEATRNSGALKLGLATEIAEGATFDLNYGAQIASGDFRQSVKAGVRVAF
ncbi:autotransporter outer membrane beta-barrel domain-containing protein [Rhizobium sp. G187]|uniref:autotransporter outer membrane beta-barrel domain-containing protein n=1 Tax=Rhizobium sp. G187 TaxID=3451352 RepID=UPI003EE429DD